MFLIILTGAAVSFKFTSGWITKEGETTMTKFVFLFKRSQLASISDSKRVLVKSN